MLVHAGTICPSALSRRAALLLAAALGLCGCPKPADKFKAFEDKTPTPDASMIDAPMGTVADITGQFHFVISAGLAPDAPLQFVATNKLTQNADGTATLDISLQPLKVPPERTPIGPPFVKNGVMVGTDGQLVIDFGMRTLTGAANPISGSEIMATLIMGGTILSKDKFCGGAMGMVISPIMYTLEPSSSRWGAVRIPDGQVGAALPMPDITCGGATPDAGTPDAAPAADAAPAQDAAAQADTASPTG